MDARAVQLQYSFLSAKFVHRSKIPKLSGYIFSVCVCVCVCAYCEVAKEIYLSHTYTYLHTCIKTGARTRHQTEHRVPGNEAKEMSGGQTARVHSHIRAETVLKARKA
jgi:hypothetical protein